jgi:hypothetical protein
MGKRMIEDRYFDIVTVVTSKGKGDDKVQVTSYDVVVYEMDGFMIPSVVVERCGFESEEEAIQYGARLCE